MQKKAITHLKLNLANSGKLAALDALADEYQRVVQCYVDDLTDTGSAQPDKYADLPTLATALSARWQRCAWQQACGLVQSWFSNERVNRPVVRGGCIQGNANVVVLERSETPTFDLWLRISTSSSVPGSLCCTGTKASPMAFPSVGEKVPEVTSPIFSPPA